MSYLSVDGVRLHYREEGEGAALLMTHAFGATASMWQPQVAALSDSFRSIVWDMRGHGLSDSPKNPADYSEAACVNDMLAILDHLGIEKAVLCGLSLGGYMSLAFHLAHPQRVRALILMSCGPGYRSDSGREKWNRFADRLAGRIEEKGLEALGDGSEIRIDEHRSADGLVKAARGMLAQSDDRVICSLQDIGVPTLVVAGDDDTQYHASADYMANKIPGAKAVRIAGAGHAGNLQKPEVYNGHLRQFIDGLQGR